MRPSPHNQIPYGIGCYLSAEFLEEAADGFDPAIEVRNVELLVGGVQVVVGQTEAHHHAWNLQHVLEVGDDGNGSSAANEDCLFFERVVQRFGGSLDVRIVGTNDGSWTFAVHLDRGLDAFRSELLHEGRIFLEDVVRVLVGHESHGNLRRSLGWDYGLRSGGDEASGHAVNLKRGPRPGSVENRVARFSSENFRSDFRLAVMLFVEGEALPGFQFGSGRGFHAFVEAGYQDFAFRIFHLADDLDQGEKRVRGSATVHAGVQIG